MPLNIFNPNNSWSRCVALKCIGIGVVDLKILGVGVVNFLPTPQPCLQVTIRLVFQLSATKSKHVQQPIFSV